MTRQAELTSSILPPVRTLPPAGTHQRIGLLGGSFNPPHSGHLHVADTALKRVGLDWIYWIPARGNPLKSAPADFYERLHQVRHLIGHNPRMFVSDIEYWAGLRYTVDVLAELRRHSPNAKFIWLMGADSLRNFHDWRAWRDIAQTLPICVVSRPDAGSAALNSKFAQTFATSRLRERDAALLPDHDAPAWVYLKAPFDRTSSTQLRTNAQNR